MPSHSPAVSSLPFVPSIHSGVGPTHTPAGPVPPWLLLYLVDFQEAVHLAAFILLLLHLLAEALSPALLNSVWVLEGPASTAICLPHILTGVTAPVGEEVQGENVKEAQKQCRHLGK